MSYGTVQAEKMTTESGYSLGAGNASSFKNRIINGNIVIDQRTNGTVSTPVNNTFSSVDRWKYYLSAASKCTTQQLTASPPPGFTSYLNITSTSAYSVGASESFFITQLIEGFNIADLGWGTANAKPITLSFWVQSSLTGTFGGTVVNYAQTTNWTFAYTIASANTWQQVSITLTGPTTGAWQSGTNQPAMYVAFNFSSGASAQGAPSTSWATVGAGVFAPTGQVNLLGTNGATWNITGVQFEVGTVATSFDFRSIGTELNLCQRYFQIVGGTGTEHWTMGVMATDRINIVYGLKQTMRASPSFSATSFGSAFSNLTIYAGTATYIATGSNENYMATNNVSIGFTHGGASTGGAAGYVYFNSTSARVAFSAEL
jgi:hypothetical protein